MDSFHRDIYNNLANLFQEKFVSFLIYLNMLKQNIYSKIVVVYEYMKFANDGFHS